MKTLATRARNLNTQTPRLGPIIYWMNRDMRLLDNWALIYAQTQAITTQQPLVVVFSLFDHFESAKNTQEDPMFNRMKMGLKLVREEAKAKGISFYVLHGPTIQRLTDFSQEIKAGLFVTDFSPLREMRQLREVLAKSLSIPMVEVDAHNIVPVHVASDKQEWGAYTLRPKIHRLLPTYLEPFPQFITTKSLVYHGQHDESFLDNIKVTIDPQAALKDFMQHRLNRYEQRNDPTLDATSRLSSYFHFGQLGSQTVALAVKATGQDHEAFLEEMIVRKELADNFCFYNPYYDQVKGFPDWAKKTLDLHRYDKREYLYSLDQFAQGKTHDEAWNAAQMQMVKTGYMHGYMRMYWAKKILEWTATPEDALRIANSLNDQSEFDGRDPNGYTGTAWAIGGVHDRPWQERPIFGMIRYMNAAGLKRKFDIGAYIRQWLNPGSSVK
ncbi:MAG: deoxyribodipyrimidine photo-lyase [Bacilli bacterium]